ncbi:hypothetical protein [Fibrella aquatilis]|uniref:Lipoprotein n=1 Tax=Fibrella aquatilis TaxID=2817059 RepID=A0A939G7C3_9BACT|nr:hypothetical protein [Fibrella aquatilis]MBO0933762.1 hypothetical protein [Fibrella aquatilis]
MRIFFIIILLATLVSSCQKAPDYSGIWVSSDDPYRFEITKVNEKVYNLKYFEPKSGTIESKASGEYELDTKDNSIVHISPLVPSKDGGFDKNGIPLPPTPPEPPKEFRLKLSDDGRLYSGNSFYTKQ